MNKCFSCFKEINGDDNIGRSETCPHCSIDLHCCYNCKFHDKSVYNECRESQADRVLEKDRSNFCDYFAFAPDSGSGAAAGSRQGRAGNPLDDLFKK